MVTNFDVSGAWAQPFLWETCGIAWSLCHPWGLWDDVLFVAHGWGQRPCVVGQFLRSFLDRPGHGHRVSSEEDDWEEDIQQADAIAGWRTSGFRSKLEWMQRDLQKVDRDTQFPMLRCWVPCFSETVWTVEGEIGFRGHLPGPDGSRRPRFPLHAVAFEYPELLRVGGRAELFGGIGEYVDGRVPCLENEGAPLLPTTLPEPPGLSPLLENKAGQCFGHLGTNFVFLLSLVQYHIMIRSYCW